MCRRASRRQCGSRAPCRKGSAAFLLIRALWRGVEGVEKKWKRRGEIKDGGEKEERPRDAASDVFLLHQKEGHGSSGKLEVLELISSDGA